MSKYLPNLDCYIAILGYCDGILVRNGNMGQMCNLLDILDKYVHEKQLTQNLLYKSSLLTAYIKENLRNVDHINECVLVIIHCCF